MKKILITGSGGLIGSEAARMYISRGHNVLGVDNNMRKVFFGEKGDVTTSIKKLIEMKGDYSHSYIDIRDRGIVDYFFKHTKIDAIIHCAAQPSHDLAATIPFDDFETNAVGTLNLLEATRKHCPEAAFVYVSTNKVYGDRPNTIQLEEHDLRWDLPSSSKDGFDESLSIDNCMHSLFGVSKASADLLAQEYGKYFKMNVGVFRGGCLTGPNHAGVELHGFLSYIIKCAMHDQKYTVFGYKGKQVRDQIHSSDVISAFDCFINNPKQGEVYNIGGGRSNSASILEIIALIKEVSGKELRWTYSDIARKGDHICYITNMRKFMIDYPEWKMKMSLKDIVKEIVENERHNVK